MYIDVFNGDADGICAIHQIRLAEQVDSKLITGIKRDIKLLDRVQAGEGDHVTVLDISLDKNRSALLRLLDNDVDVKYIDHHYAGDIPQHNKLTAIIDTQPNVCTSLLVNEMLQNRYLPWAVTAAFGDNLFDSAIQAATSLNLSAAELEALKVLGICINYNGYGASLEDLFFHPADLYKKIKPYTNPFEFIEKDDAYKILKSGYEEDMSCAEKTTPEAIYEKSAVYVLPDAKWARRVSGIYSNDLAQNHPDRAHAVLTKTEQDFFVVSVRAPLKTKTGADTFCMQFETGGGRQAAAGINKLPEADLTRFIDLFHQHFK